MSSSGGSYCEARPISVQFDNIDMLDVMFHDTFGTWLVNQITYSSPDNLGESTLSVTRLDSLAGNAGDTGKIHNSTLHDWVRLHNLLDLYSDLS